MGTLTDILKSDSIGGALGYAGIFSSSIALKDTDLTNAQIAASTLTIGALTYSAGIIGTHIKTNMPHYKEKTKSLSKDIKTHLKSLMSMLVLNNSVKFVATCYGLNYMSPEYIALALMPFDTATYTTRHYINKINGMYDKKTLDIQDN